MDYIRKQTLESWTPGILGPSSPTKLEKNQKYELWKDLIFRHGPSILKEFPGFHDEKLKGERKGQRSSRLSLQYRVIYSVKEDIITVYVLEITPYNY